MKLKPFFLFSLALGLAVFGTIAITGGGVSPAKERSIKSSSEKAVAQKTAKLVTPKQTARQDIQKQENNATSSLATVLPKKTEQHEKIEEYNGPVRHIFFHSLIVYPKKALADTGNINGYKDNMLTVGQFQQALNQLYKNNFLLIDGKLLYSLSGNGGIRENKLFLPAGKKPLIISVDDLSYYSYMENGGFARKLVLDGNIVKTEVLTPQGNIVITDNGDVVPIIDAFVKEHPDFSLNGAKGIIGLTGFEGILGYRTQLKGRRGNLERRSVVPVVNALKDSGWMFACHSYGHDQNYLNGTASLAFLKTDIALWASEVEPLVGPTNIFIGPFGQVFTDKDVRRKMLVDKGFNVLYGVGTDGYLKFFNNHLVMNRTDIDGYRIAHNPEKLYELFRISIKESF